MAISDFRDFFKAQGIADRFFGTYLRPFVSGEPDNYRLRSIDGLSLPVSKVYLDQLVSVHAIRQSFFAENPAEPQVRFKLEPYTLDSTVSRSEFTFDDKILEYRHGPIVPVSLSEDGVRLFDFDFGLGQAEDGILPGLAHLRRDRFQRLDARLRRPGAARRSAAVGQRRRVSCGPGAL